MSNWKEYILGDLGHTYTGLSGKNKDDFGKGKPYIPYLNIFTNSRIDPSFLDYVDVKQGEKQNTVKSGDLFFTTSSETVEEVGMTSVLLDDLKEAYLNSFCFGFRLNNFDILLPEFARFLFRSEIVRKKISDLGQGSTRFNLPKTELLQRLKLKIPSKPEQLKIAEILCAVEAVIEKTQQAIAKYKCIKQGMLHDLFTRGIGADGKLRPTVQQAPELYKPSALGMIPMEWDEDTLTNLSELITDGSHFSPTPISDGHLIVNVKDMGEYDINYDTCTRISEREFLLLKDQNCSPKKGDVLLSKDGTVGRVLLYNGNREVVVLSSIAIIRPGEKLISEYLYLFLQTDYFEKQLRALMSGSALKRIVLRDINLLKSVYPKNKEEQGAIFKMMSSIENKIQQEEKYLFKVISLKQGLMADLLTGKKEVTINEELVSEKAMMV